MTITEALAEIKTIGKRIAKKRQGLGQYLARVEALRDPLEADGGSVEFIRRERQAIADLEERVIVLRRAIAKANAETTVAINGTMRTIADWLTWRREVAPELGRFLGGLRGAVERARNDAARQGAQVISAAAAVQVSDRKPTDVVVNVSEVELAAEIDNLEEVLGELDGLLSLRNATTTVEV